jgi:hypothetical protein
LDRSHPDTLPTATTQNHPRVVSFNETPEQQSHSKNLSYLPIRAGERGKKGFKLNFAGRIS